MADYKETTTTGKTWQRCYTVNITNHLTSPPRAVFFEEKVAQFGENQVTTPVGNVNIDFNPAEGTFPVLNPQTGEPTGAISSHAELYTLLFSLYMQAATARDLANA